MKEVINSEWTKLIHLYNKVFSEVDVNDADNLTSFNLLFINENMSLFDSIFDSFNSRIDIRAINSYSTDENIILLLKTYFENKNIEVYYNGFIEGSYKDINNLSLYFEEMSACPLLSKDEEFSLFEEYSKSHDEKIRDKILISNLKLVIFFAKKFNGHNNIDLLDLIQEGNLGLFDAIEHFDIAKGFKFSTYASSWILLRIKTYINQKLDIIRIPLKKKTDLYAYNVLVSEFEESTGKKPSNEEAALILGLNVKYVCELSKIPNSCSYDYLFFNNDDDDRTRNADDLLQADHTKSVENLVIENILKEDFNDNLFDLLGDILTRNEFIVLMNRCYYNDSEGQMSYKGLASLLGVSIQRILQIKNSAIMKLRRNTIFRKRYASFVGASDKVDTVTYDKRHDKHSLKV
ncbi:MAG: sigma-70 family RNA polymerase sigma factor [Bacilli bacterium]